MNTDRFLTRVWDKELKKMTYLNEPIGDGGDIFIGIKDDEMITAYPQGARHPAKKDHFLEGMWEFIVGMWKFGDRFIPMRCTGWRDGEEKLMYAGDIVLDNHEYFTGFITDLGNVFEIRDSNCYRSVALVGGNMQSVIGNIHEHPALPEEK